MTQRQTQTSQYWEENLIIEDADIEHLYNLLLEDETPLTIEELALAIIRRRVEREELALRRQAQTSGAIYLPNETYAVGQELIFPQFQFATGRVAAVRPGVNPEIGAFDVLTVDFGDEQAPREFAARLSDHKLNQANRVDGGLNETRTPDEILAEHGKSVAAKIETRFRDRGDIVRLAGRWFPRALLADINQGHLNLAEAVLDMGGGGPLPTEALVPHLDLPETINSNLKVFSLNYALQEDRRFDEVGPAGQVLWFLNRLEPAEVLTPPRYLIPDATGAEVELPEVLADLENALHDEFGMGNGDLGPVDEVDLNLTFPHLRAGTLPLSAGLATLFPTAYVTPRIRFTLVDAHTGEKRPGWVVRPGRYVFGLADWYRKYEVLVGGAIAVKRGDAPGEVLVQIGRRKPVREWVRSVAVNEGRVSFTMQKRPVAVDYDEQMIVAVDNLSAIDQVWQRLDERRPSLDRIVADMFRELAKLTTQSAVHARSLYSAVNVIRRVPPAPIFAELVSRPYFVHVGDAYWRFDDSRYNE